MSHFFIKMLDVLIGLFVIAGLIGVVVAAFVATTDAGGAAANSPLGGVALGAAVLIGGTIYIAFIAGFLYLGIGIYHNTRRTADAVELLTRKETAPRGETGGRKEPSLRKPPTL